ncbi:hypothetical protein J3F83DRAFT_109313 [Trichoderma novae-zelandiae]
MLSSHRGVMMEERSTGRAQCAFSWIYNEVLSRSSGCRVSSTQIHRHLATASSSSSSTLFAPLIHSSKRSSHNTPHTSNILKATMANVQILSQPDQANADQTLFPAITLQQQLEAEPTLYFAHAALFDTAGNAVNGVLQGDRNATGKPVEGGIRYAFANLTITKAGQYYILVNIFKGGNGADFLGRAKSETITVA